MRSACVLLLTSSLGCASLPRVSPVATEAERSQIAAACREVFPNPPWSASHAIEAAMPLGNRASLIGVTRMSSEGLDTVLLSPEGIVLFDASTRNGRISVRRALPPLDQGAFAQGLIEDVQHAFVAPKGEPQWIGRSDLGNPVCRWKSGDRETTDVLLGGRSVASIQSQSAPSIHNYDGASLVREVTLSDSGSQGFFSEVVLRVPGAMGYRLRLRLIDHETPSSRSESKEAE